MTHVGDAAYDGAAQCGTIARPRLREVHSGLLSSFNRLARMPAALPLNDEYWTCRLQPPGNAAPAGSGLMRWQLMWDDCLLHLDMSAAGMQQLFEGSGCGCPFEELPDEIILAVGQLLLEDLSALLAARRLPPLHLVRIDTGGSLPDVDGPMYRVDWEAEPEHSGPRLHGTLATTAAGLERLAMLMDDAEPGTSLDDWSALPVPVSMELGYVYLPLNELKSLCEGDVILADAAWSDAAAQSTALRLADHLLVLGTIGADGRITATSRVCSMPTEPYEMPDDDRGPDNFSGDAGLPHPAGAGIDSLPVRLNFDLGERTISLGELAGIQPGYVFDLALPASRAVTLRANGVRVGEGELVEIDGRIGVAVTRIRAPQTS